MPPPPGLKAFVGSRAGQPGDPIPAKVAKVTTQEGEGAMVELPSRPADEEETMSEDGWRGSSEHPSAPRV